MSCDQLRVGGINAVVVDQQRGLFVGGPSVAKTLVDKWHASGIGPHLRHLGSALLEFLPFVVRRLVDHIPDVDQAAEPRDAVGDPFHLESPHLLQIIRQPARLEVIPRQGMALGGDAVVAAPLGHLLRVLMLRLSLPGFIRGPVERQGRIVEQVGKLVAVRVLILRVASFAELEEIAAEQELVTRLLNRHLDVGQRLAGRVHDHERRIGLAMLLDPLSGPLQQILFGSSRRRLCPLVQAEPDTQA